MSDPLLLTLTACSLLAFPLFQMVAQGWTTQKVVQKAASFRNRHLSVLRQAAEIARLNSELHSRPSRSSVPWRVLEVAQVEGESSDCRSFYLVDPYRQSLPDFLPGQHVLVKPTMAGANAVTRCYSLSAAPNPHYWRITVKRQVPAEHVRNAAHQGGLSGWLNQTISPGDCLLIGGPVGNFVLAADNPRPIVLVAAGVGITPLASMLQWSQEHTPGRSVALVYQAQDHEHWPLGLSLHQQHRPEDGTYIHTVFSRIAAEELQPFRARLPGKFSSGKVNGTQLTRIFPDSVCDYFLCGPQKWMDMLRDEIIAAGVSTAHIHWESFGSAPSRAVPGGRRGDAVSVKFQRSGVEVEHDDAEQTLWELAREHQVVIQSGCLSGVCGSCKVGLISGQVAYDCSVGIELAPNECLPCVARPTSPVVLDA